MCFHLPTDEATDSKIMLAQILNSCKLSQNLSVALHAVLCIHLNTMTSLATFTIVCPENYWNLF